MGVLSSLGLRLEAGSEPPDRLVMALWGCEARVVRGEPNKLGLTLGLLIRVWLSKLSQKLGGDSWSKLGEFSRGSEALRGMLDTLVLYAVAAEMPVKVSIGHTVP